MAVISMYAIEQVAQKVQEAEKAKSESDAITCSGIEMQSEHSDVQGRAQADDSRNHEGSRR